MTIADAIAIWTAEGKPVLNLGPGETCFDMEKLLTWGEINERHLKIVKDWLEAKKRDEDKKNAL